LAAVCFLSAADAADLSMTPIYKSRPSTASSPDGRLKGEYRSFSFASPGQLERPFADAAAGPAAKPRDPIKSREIRTSMDARFYDFALRP
jgi:hypothetical protein